MRWLIRWWNRPVKIVRMGQVSPDNTPGARARVEGEDE